MAAEAPKAISVNWIPVRLSKRGLALALSLRMGIVQQLIDGSRTYPDRLFFLGGADSIRGFSQDSVVPQDIADQPPRHRLGGAGNRAVAIAVDVQHDARRFSERQHRSGPRPHPLPRVT